MTIRQAKINSDLPRIVDIAKQHYFTIPDNRTSGFYNYMPREEQFVRIIENNPYCLVSETSSGINGFITALDSLRTEDIYKWNKNPVLNKVLEFPKPFLYVDQIAVRNLGTLEGSKVAKSLGDRVIELALEGNISRILALTAFCPWRNNSSERFLLGYDFKCIGKISDQAEGLLNLWIKELELQNI